MVGAVEHLILLLMARTNHTFPSYRGGGEFERKRNQQYQRGKLEFGGRSWSIWGEKLEYLGKAISRCPNWIKDRIMAIEDAVKLSMMKPHGSKEMYTFLCTVT